jgi:hypothetical protein
MTQERLTMRKIAEVLRLKWECGLPNRAIARSCSISHSTVAEYLRRAQQAGLSWPLPDDLGEDTLYELLFPKASRPDSRVILGIPMKPSTSSDHAVHPSERSDASTIIILQVVGMDKGESVLRRDSPLRASR